jgi:hypothetical protein
MNPNYLFKDELNYELGVRGITSNADTQELRKLFRSLVGEDLVVESSYLCERFSRIVPSCLKEDRCEALSPL